LGGKEEIHVSAKIAGFVRNKWVNFYSGRLSFKKLRKTKHILSFKKRILRYQPVFKH
jgi:hypothetical protein